MEIKGEHQIINGTARQKQNYKTHTNLHPEKRRACLLASIPVPWYLVMSAAMKLRDAAIIAISSFSAAQLHPFTLWTCGFSGATK